MSSNVYTRGSVNMNNFGAELKYFLTNKKIEFFVSGIKWFLCNLCILTHFHIGQHFVPTMSFIIGGTKSVNLPN